MKKTINVAIIGVGKSGMAFGKVLQSLPNVNIHAIAASRAESAQNAAAALGVERWYTDYRKLLEDKEVNAVFIATPTYLHADMVVAAAQAQKHMLCEKPMSLTLEEADSMIEATRSAQVKFMVGFTERFNVPFIRVKEMIASGRIGTPVMLWCQRGHPLRKEEWITDDAKSGGALIHTGVHNIDLIRWFTNSEVCRVYAEMGNLIATDSNFTDSTALVLRMESGAIATLVENYAFPATMPHSVDRGMEILGTEGIIRVDMLNQPISVWDSTGVKIEDTLTWPQIAGEIKGAIKAEIEYFIKCITQDINPEVGGKEGRKSLEVAIAAREAYETRTIINLPLAKT